MARSSVVLILLGFFLTTQLSPSLQVGGYGAYRGAGRSYAGTGGLKAAKSGIGLPGGGLPGRVLSGGILPGGPGTGKIVAGLPGQVFPQTGVQGSVGPGGKFAKAGKVPVPGMGVPGLYQGGLVPGQGFNGRGVLPGVATGKGLKPKSGGRVYGGPLQQGVFHGYPLKSPKVPGAGSPYTGGKLPGYGGFGGSAGLPGGKTLSKPGYPTGTGVGSLRVSAAQTKAAKYGTGASLSGTGSLPGGPGGLYFGAGGVLTPNQAKAAKYGVGIPGISGVPGIGGVFPGAVPGGPFFAQTKVAKYGAGAVPGGAGIVPGTPFVPGAGGIYPGGVFSGTGGGVVWGAGGVPGTGPRAGVYSGGSKPPKYGYPAGVKPPKYGGSGTLPGTGTVLGTGEAPVLRTGTGLAPGARIGGYPSAVKPPKTSFGITGTGATPGGTGLMVVPRGTGVSVFGGTGGPAAPSGKPVKFPTLASEGTAVPGGVYLGTYGGYPHAYPAKAAKYGGALSGFLGGSYRVGGAGCQGKYCGRRRK